MMLKKTYIQLCIGLLVLSLMVIPVFSGCKGEIAETVNVSNTGNEEQVVETEDPEETEEAEAVQTDEPAEETDGPAQIMPITPEEVFDIIENNEDYLIVDVRTKEEFEGGHLGSALLLPVQELEGRLDELPKDKPIIVYCRSGNRSRTAAEILVNNGFTRIYDMGGISSWTEKGYPVVVE